MDDEFFEEYEEPITCERCGFVNIVRTKPFYRRTTRNRHIALDNAVYSRLKDLSRDYPSINVGLQYMFSKFDSMVKENDRQRETQ